MASKPTFDDPGRPLVVLCSGNHLLTAKQDAEAHLARHLTSHANVVFVDPPVSSLGARRRSELASTSDGPRLRRIAPALIHLTPLVAPKPFTRATTRITAATVRHAIERTVHHLGARDVTLITTWPFCDVTAAVPWRRSVYWRTDDPVAAATLWRLDRSMLRRGDEQMMGQCDIVATVDGETAARLSHDGIDARFLPNGCDTSTMAQTDSVESAPGIDLPPPVAGFIGLLNDRTDLSLLERVVDRGSSLLVLGPHQAGFADDRIAALRERPTVRFVGPVPFRDVPSYLTHVDVGLVPYTDTPFNRASFPLKALEYLAAGRPVAATDLPALRWLQHDLGTASNDAGAIDLRLSASPDTFADDVVDLAGSRSDHDVERRRHIARRHDWSTRADLMAEWCGLATRQERPDGSRGPSSEAPVGRRP